MTVTAPDGRTWRVARRWLPWRLKMRRSVRRGRRRADNLADVADGADIASGCAVDFLDDLLIGVAVVAVVVLLVVFVVPMVVALIEVAILALLVVVGVAARVVLRRPWIIDAYAIGPGRPTPEQHSWKVVGWRASGAAVREVAESLRTGTVPGRLPSPS